MTQWSENYVSADFGDLQANSMAVDCLGKWAVLAGRRVLVLVDLDDPQEHYSRLTRQSKWDISCVQWNPHASHTQLFCTACTQKLELYNWEGATSKPVCSMRAHSRTISAIDWSPFDVNVIASCSTDTYTHLWDVRDPKKPTHSFQSVCGASQVQWNKVTNNLFATAHEGDVRVWDPRKGNTPVVYLTAHLSKIHGIDWSPVQEHTFVTSSQDCSVKFWDFTNTRQNKGILNSGSPVWRARYTPFGEGLVTVVLSTLRRGENSLFLWNNNTSDQPVLTPVPFGEGLVTVVLSTLRRGENSLFLWNNNTTDQPVHQFVGHSDVVLDFQWRKKYERNRDFHLVTWSKDQNLKIWKVDPQLQRLCGHETVDSSENECTCQDMTDSQITINGGTPGAGSDRSPAMSGSSPQAPRLDQGPDMNLVLQPMTLQKEFSLLNKYIPGVSIEQMDLSSRQCLAVFTSGKHSVTLTITFPTYYPNSAGPEFHIPTNSGLSQSVINKLLKVLKETSQMHMKRRVNCLEPCIRQFATAFKSMNLEERKTPDSEDFPPPTTPNKMQHPFKPLPFAAFQDYTIPFPRTCGAQFNSAGLLVCFGRSRDANKASEKTPKALSELAAYTSTNRVRSSQSSSGFTNMFSRSPPTTKSEQMSISVYYNMPKVQRQRTKSRPSNKDLLEDKHRRSDKVIKKEKKTVKVDPVRIYDSLCLLAVHRELGEKYRLDLQNIEEMCSHNKKEAAAVGRTDLVRLWCLVSMVSNPMLKPSPDPDDGPPWGQNPLGRQMLESLIDYYKKIYDVQTLAMLCCVFWDRRHVPQSQPPKMQKSASKSSLDYVPANYNPYHTVSSMSGLLRSLTTAQSTSITSTMEPAGTSPHSPQTSDSLYHTMPAFLSRAMVKVRRTNSLTEFSFADDNYKMEDDGGDTSRDRSEEIEKKHHEVKSRLLDPSRYHQYDHFLKVYADILYRWGLQNQATDVLKHVTVPPEQHSGLEFGVKCHNCKTDGRGAKCGTCKMLALNCVICHMGVRGASNFCLYCGHGGHASHLREWFKTEDQCAYGCGCKCLKYNPF